jgi:4-hydroxy 2-oxovalerate aldolase
MKEIKILDATLRDGGCVIDFDFGQEYMNRILAALESSGVDYIEVGYIDDKHGSSHARTQYCNEVVIEENFLQEKLPGIKYVAMVDFGKFDFYQLGRRTERSIDGIRLAFHKNNWRDVITVGREVIKKGYQLFIQPMITMRYSDQELLELIDAVNTSLPDASGFYIVDTFGEMRHNDVFRLMHLVDNNLISSMLLGLHSHNNLQLSYSNAMSLLDFPTNRELMLDACVMGMGKGAGNLNTELLMEHMNLYHDKNYNIFPLLKLVDQVINTIRSEASWGYSVEYYLSSINRCTPTYANHFYKKHMLTIDRMAELLSMIDENKKISYDEFYAEELYYEYNARNDCDDSLVIQKLHQELNDKRVVLIAPGPSISNNREAIEKIISQEDVVSISLNNFEFDTNYVLITRDDRVDEAIENGYNLIIPSNKVLDASSSKQVYRISYKKWAIFSEKAHDSSGVFGLRLFSSFNIKELMLAGFDGFSVNINANHIYKINRRPISEQEANQMNTFFSNLIKEIKDKVNVTFLTNSIYDKRMQSIYLKQFVLAKKDVV